MSWDNILKKNPFQERAPHPPCNKLPNIESRLSYFKYSLFPLYKYISRIFTKHSKYFLWWIWNGRIMHRRCTQSFLRHNGSTNNNTDDKKGWILIPMIIFTIILQLFIIAFKMDVDKMHFILMFWNGKLSISTKINRIPSSMHYRDPLKNIK